jgi:hypothetical protein
MLGKLYRHYRGGIYQVIALADSIKHENIDQICELYCYGGCTETNKLINVYKDKDNNLWINNYFNDIAVIYKDIKGVLWIRPKSIFLEQGRFTEIKGDSER